MPTTRVRARWVHESTPNQEAEETVVEVPVSGHTLTVCKFGQAADIIEPYLGPRRHLVSYDVLTGETQTVSSVS